MLQTFERRQRDRATPRFLSKMGFHKIMFTKWNLRWNIFCFRKLLDLPKPLQDICQTFGNPTHYNPAENRSKGARSVLMEKGQLLITNQFYWKCRIFSEINFSYNFNLRFEKIVRNIYQVISLVEGFVFSWLCSNNTVTGPQVISILNKK